MRLVVSKYLQEKWSLNEQYLAFDKFVETELNKRGVEKKNITTLPFLRTSVDDLIKNSTYVSNKYETYVRLLSERFNEVHGKKYSLLFWKTAMSLHLPRYITFLHDFYFTINKVDLKGYYFDLISNDEINSPVNFEEQRELLQSSDIVNDILLKLYVDYKQGVSFPNKNNVDFKRVEIKKQSLKTKIKAIIISLINNLTPKKGSIYLGLINMEKYYGQDLKNIGCDKVKLNIDFQVVNKNHGASRNRLFNKIQDLDEFDNYFLFVSYYLFPQHLIESFNDLIFDIDNKIKRYYKKEYVLSETWIFSSIISIAIGLLKEKGVKLVTVEHNAISHIYEGNYTAYLESITDVYLTLGWNKVNDDKFVSGKFYFLAPPTDSVNKKGILYISGAPQVKMAIHSTFYSLCAEFAPIHFKYVEEFFRLGKGLPFMSDLTYRGYPKKKMSIPMIKNFF